MGKLYTTTFIFVLSVSLLAQTQESLRFSHLSLDDGISHNLVYAITQDSDGYIWLGSMYGLARYDGRSYHEFRHDPADPTSLSFNDVVSLFVDSKGDLWVGTWGGGLNKYDRSTDSFERYLADQSATEAISGNIVWTISETVSDSTRSIWIGTERAGLTRIHYSLDQTSPQFLNVARDSLNDHFPANYVNSLLTDRHGTLWAGTVNGIAATRNPEAAQPDWEIFLADSSSRAGPQFNYVSDLFEDGTGNLWISTIGGGLALVAAQDRQTLHRSSVYQHDPEDSQSIASNFINFCREDSQGNLWIGTYQGLSILPHGKRAHGEFISLHQDAARDGSLSSNNVIAFCEDRGGNIFLGTYHGGVDTYTPLSNRFRTITAIPDVKDEMPVNVTALHEDRSGIVWMGTARHGLLSSHQSNSAQELDFSPPPVGEELTDLFRSTGITTVSEMVVEDQRILAVGTQRRGLHLLKRDGANYGSLAANGIIDHSVNERIQRTRVSAVLQTSQSNLWIGTMAGLHRLEPGNTNSSSHYTASDQTITLPHNWVLTLFEDSQQRIWIGTYGGLTKFDPSTGQSFSYVHDPYDVSGLCNNYVYAIAEDNNGLLWIGTAGGIAILDTETSHFRSVTVNNGLKNDVVGALIFDSQSNLWMSTQAGLTRIRKAVEWINSNMALSSITPPLNFDVRDGLPSNLFAPGVGIRTASGTMLWGSQAGLVAVDPTQISASSFEPAIVTHTSDVSGSPLRLTDTDLPHTENSLRFKFTALDYRVPSKINYRFRLSGYESTWNYCGNNNTATYTNLPPGDYLFEVQSTNSDGVWVNNQTTTAFIIRPPFWQTAAFISGMLLLLASILYTAYRLRLHQQVERRLALEQARREERALVREKTARDYHDELGHQITKISLYSELVRRDMAELAPGSEVEKHLEKITTASDALSNDTRDFIWVVNPEMDSLYEVMRHLQGFGQELFSDSSIHFTVQGFSELLQQLSLTMDARRHLNLLFKEALTNILRHSQASTANLRTIVEEESLRIILQDDGVGIDLDSVRYGNGIKNIHIRAQKLNGIIRFESQPGCGTSIEYEGPIANIRREEQS